MLLKKEVANTLKERGGRVMTGGATAVTFFYDKMINVSAPAPSKLPVLEGLVLKLVWAKLEEKREGGRTS